MKFFKKMKDGGAESTVTGYWLIEVKSLFSIVLLKFEGESRNAFHTHAFNSISWLLSGKLGESCYQGPRRIRNYVYKPGWLPILTSKNNCHKVDSIGGTSWVISFRGPWDVYWTEYLPNENRERTLTHGRVEV